MRWIKVLPDQDMEGTKFGRQTRLVYELLKAAADESGVVSKPLDVVPFVHLAIETGQIQTRRSAREVFFGCVAKLKGRFVETAPYCRNKS